MADQAWPMRSLLWPVVASRTKSSMVAATSAVLTGTGGRRPRPPP
jgi:hypothetical protein